MQDVESTLGPGTGRESLAVSGRTLALLGAGVVVAIVVVGGLALFREDDNRPGGRGKGGPSAGKGTNDTKTDPKDNKGGVTPPPQGSNGTSGTGSTPPKQNGNGGRKTNNDNNQRPGPGGGTRVE